MESDDGEGLITAITEAIEARRPRLAARLVGLLDQHVEIEAGSPLARARDAAAMVLVSRQELPVGWSDLEDAWGETRRHRMDRIRERMRRSTNPDDSGGRIGRLHGRRRRR